MVNTKSYNSRDSSKRERGFTLIEVVLVSTMFATVLTMAYLILVDTLEAEVAVRETTQSGKVGESILTLIRRDLQGIVVDGMGRQVFFAEDRGDDENAEDNVHFLTTAPVPSPSDATDEFEWEEYEFARGVASVGYVIKPGTTGDGGTLFRRVKWYFEESPWEGERYYPIYNRVTAFSLRYLDEEGEWLGEWNSEDRIPEEEEEDEGLEDDLLAPQPIDSDPTEEEEPEPIPVPRAVEIILYIQFGDEDGPKLDAKGNAIVERYSTIVPLLASETIFIAPELTEEDETTEGR